MPRCNHNRQYIWWWCNKAAWCTTITASCLWRKRLKFCETANLEDWACFVHYNYAISRLHYVARTLWYVTIIPLIMWQILRACWLASWAVWIPCNGRGNSGLLLRTYTRITGFPKWRILAEKKCHIHRIHKYGGRADWAWSEFSAA